MDKSCLLAGNTLEVNHSQNTKDNVQVQQFKFYTDKHLTVTFSLSEHWLMKVFFVQEKFKPV